MSTLITTPTPTTKSLGQQKIVNKGSGLGRTRGASLGKSLEKPSAQQKNGNDEITIVR